MGWAICSHERCPAAHRFVDLFAGSGAVAIHVARTFNVPVVAIDLQRYSVILTNAVIGRNVPIRWASSFSTWTRRAQALVDMRRVPSVEKLSARSVLAARSWCAAQTDLPITEAYGGHYFSPEQAVWIDSLRRTVPVSEPAKTVALAALGKAASKCAAAPGHTAQPFQPTLTAKEFLADSWRKDLLTRTREAFEVLAGKFALQAGRAHVGDANTAASKLEEGDLAFIDPPYSGVQYSRFYHVLETIADGFCGVVTGVGRYPDQARRPKSNYSLTSQSAAVVGDLLKVVSMRGARAILTFPVHDCSNGLSGKRVSALAKQHFHVTKFHVASRFSTLGGVGLNRMADRARAARLHADELMLLLDPR